MSTTPLLQAKKLAAALNIKNDLYLKREDQHKYGSHKGRSIPLMIKTYQKNIRNFVISSSGNAALAAAHHIKDYNQKNKKNNLTLTIFVGKNIPSVKLAALKKLLNKNITLQQVINPKQAAFKASKNPSIHWLRQSTDDVALLGYESLAKELAKIKNLQAIFIPTSSGTTAAGLYNEFKKLKSKTQIHIVQTTACHPFIDSPHSTPTSLATAIVDKVGHRKKQVLEVIKKSKGDGYVATDEEIQTAIKLVKKTENLNISTNSALSLVGLIQYLQKKKRVSGAIVLLITGK